ELYLAGIFVFGAALRSSSPATVGRISTRCLPTTAPALPPTTFKAYSPLSLVRPVDPMPGFNGPSPAGWKMTTTFARGLPSLVTVPDTGAWLESPQPRASSSIGATVSNSLLRMWATPQKSTGTGSLPATVQRAWNTLMLMPVLIDTTWPSQQTNGIVPEWELPQPYLQSCGSAP